MWGAEDFPRSIVAVFAAECEYSKNIRRSWEKAFEVPAPNKIC